MGKRKQGKWDGEGGGGGKRKKAGYFATVCKGCWQVAMCCISDYHLCYELNTLEYSLQNTKVSLPKCRGFLVSCWSGKEQQASREAIELLQEVHEYLPETSYC